MLIILALLLSLLSIYLVRTDYDIDLFGLLFCIFFCFFFFCFFNDTATTEIYTRSLVGSVRCV